MKRAQLAVNGYHRVGAAEVDGGLSGSTPDIQDFRRTFALLSQRSSCCPPRSSRNSSRP